MARSFYSHIRDAWKNPGEGKLAELQWQRQQEWRKQGAIERVERPTRLDKARTLGYKAKQGVVVARVSVRKGGARKQRFKAGRRSKRQGVKKITRRKNLQRIAEERANRKYRNLRTLASYWVGEDGSQKWFEVVLLDPEHPAIENDDDLNWICDDTQRGRAFRGLRAHPPQHQLRPQPRQVGTLAFGFVLSISTASGVVRPIAVNTSKAGAFEVVVRVASGSSELSRYTPSLVPLATISGKPPHFQ